MFIYDLIRIGNRLYEFRRLRGLTQIEVGELAGISGRTYADIERGTVNMRMDTALKICDVLHITPNDIYVDDEEMKRIDIERINEKLKDCTSSERIAVMRLIDVYMNSIKR